MQIETFLSPKDFLRAAGPMLEAYETRNSLMLGIALRLAEHPEWTEIQPYLAAVQNADGQVRLAATITPPHNLLLVAEPSQDNAFLDQAARLLIKNLLAGSWPVPGLLAETRLAHQFASAWEQAANQTARVEMNERLYELRTVIQPPNPPPGRLRLAVLDEIDLVGRWHHEFSVEALGKGELADSLKFARQRIPQGDLFLWEDQEPVSMAMRTRPSRHGWAVSAVYTPPNRRGRGYASACVAGLSQLILDSCKRFCSLFTNLANPTSNFIYQKIGYVPVCDFTHIAFEKRA